MAGLASLAELREGFRFFRARCWVKTNTVGGTQITGTSLRRLQTWCAYLAMTILSVTISAVWLDKPIAHGVHFAFGRPETFGRLVGTPSLYSPLAMLVVLAFIVRRMAFQPFGKFDVALIQSEFSLILAAVIVPPMKFAFGRTWPQYHHPSLVGDDAYGFNFFHGGEAFDAFPSGHMASICALIIVFWINYPRYRPIYVISIVGMAAGLILGNFHFVSDVIAGGFVGGSTALLMVSIWETGWRGVQAIAARFRNDERGVFRSSGHS